MYLFSIIQLLILTIPFVIYFRGVESQYKWLWYITPCNINKNILIYIPLTVNKTDKFIQIGLCCVVVFVKDICQNQRFVFSFLEQKQAFLFEFLNKKHIN